MLVLNIHGFLGEADNRNYKSLCQLLEGVEIISPQLDYLVTLPSELLEMWHGYIEQAPEGEQILLVGQSLGGWYADHLSREYGLPCILTNPCYDPEKRTVIEDSDIRREAVRQMQELAPEGINPRSIVLCSKEDEVLVGNWPICEQYAGQLIEVTGAHSTINHREEELAKALKIIGWL